MSSGHFPPKSRTLIGLTAGSANQRPSFWREMAGISQFQIKGDYNFNNRELSFTICGKEILRVSLEWSPSNLRVHINKTKINKKTNCWQAKCWKFLKVISFRVQTKHGSSHYTLYTISDGGHISLQMWEV